MEVFVRMARRLKRTTRTSPSMEDYDVVGREFGRPSGSLRSWFSRYREEWGKACAAAGLQVDVATPRAVESASVREATGSDDPLALGIEAEEAAATGAGLEPPPEYEVILDHDPRVSQAQLRAICMDLDGMDRQAIANEVGVCRQTVSGWFNHDPAVRAVRTELQQEIHGQIIRGHLAVAAKGADLRLRLLGRIGRKLDEDPFLDPQDLGHLTRATNVLVESAEDRAGFPKTSISQHLVGPLDRHADLDEMTPEDLEAEDRRLAAIEADLVDDESAA